MDKFLVRFQLDVVKKEKVLDIVNWTVGYFLA